MSIGIALIVPYITLPKGVLVIEKPAVTIPQSYLGWAFVVLAATAPIIGMFRAIRGDWSRVLTGKLIAGYSYEVDQISRIVDEIGHPIGWTTVQVIDPAAGLEIWKQNKAQALEMLDQFFDSYEGNFTYQRVDEMRTRATIHIDLERIPSRWQSYVMSGMGELQDDLAGEVKEGHIRVDSRNQNNLISVRSIGDVLSVFGKGLPILLVWDEQLKPVGELRSFSNYTYFKLRYSLVLGRWIFSEGLVYLDASSSNESAKVVIGYTSDIVLK